MQFIAFEKSTVAPSHLAFPPYPTACYLYCLKVVDLVDVVVVGVVAAEAMVAVKLRLHFKRFNVRHATRFQISDANTK